MFKRILAMGNKPVKSRHGSGSGSGSGDVHSAGCSSGSASASASGPIGSGPSAMRDVEEPTGPLPTAALIHPLLEAKLAALDVTSVFSAHEIEAIHRHLATSLQQLEDEPIRFSRDEFFKFLDTTPQSLFANRVYAIFDVAGKGVVDFEDLIRGLALLSPKASRELKLLLSFHLLDSAGTGFITKQATVEMLRSVLAEGRDNDIVLGPDEITKIVESTFDEADLDHNNVIDLKEYQALDMKHPGLFDMLAVDAFGVINHLEKIHSMQAAAE